MKLVIDIPEEDYIRLRDEGMFGNVTTFKRAVREGIPLAEQEPCGDAISRQAAIDAIFFEPLYKLGMKKRYAEEAVPAIFEKIKALPPVTPQYTDTEIQKMQDLEFAEIQKGYEIGKDEGSEVLNKIRAEIVHSHDWAFSRETILRIIDKYKASPTGEEVKE